MVLLVPGPSLQAYAAVAVRSTCEEPRTAKKKKKKKVYAELNAFPDGV